MADQRSNDVSRSRVGKAQSRGLLTNFAELNAVSLVNIGSNSTYEETHAEGAYSSQMVDGLMQDVICILCAATL